jgi:Fic family protein
MHRTDSGQVQPRFIHHLVTGNEVVPKGAVVYRHCVMTLIGMTDKALNVMIQIKAYINDAKGYRMQNRYYNYPSFSPSEDMSLIIHEMQSTINRLNSFRDRGLSPQLRKKIYKYINISHVYNSNAIEGNILSLRETEVILNNLELNDKPLKDQIEARSLGRALEFLYEMINGKAEIERQNILNLHNLLMKDIPNVTSGKFRTIDVKIGGAKHIPPSHDDIEEHIRLLIEWYNQEQSLPLILKGTILHHWFVWIHPFEDGNGRIARLLLNFFFLRNGYPDVLVKITDRDRYYNALSEADIGDITPLVDLIADKLNETITVYNEFINEELREKEWLRKYQQVGLEQRKETLRYNYEVWKSTFDIFKTRFIQTVNALSGHFPDFIFSIKEYVIISFNKYLDILENRAVTNTWYFVIRIRCRDRNDLAIIFYFERWFPKTKTGRRINPIIKLFYSIRRAGHNLRENLNLDLVNVGVQRDKLVVGLRDTKNRRKITSIETLPGDVIRKFLDQLLKEYFKVC